jgi:hypothetical protein
MRIISYATWYLTSVTCLISSYGWGLTKWCRDMCIISPSLSVLDRIEREADFKPIETGD